MKTTDAERKKLKRKIQKECRDHMSEQWQQTDAITLLSEGQSLASYKRIRLAQSFETPEQTRERAQTNLMKERRHSPKFENVQWDKEGLLDKLQNWPSAAEGIRKDLVNMIESGELTLGEPCYPQKLKKICS